MEVVKAFVLVYSMVYIVQFNASYENVFKAFPQLFMRRI